jgi:hypothetical protein
MRDKTRDIEFAMLNPIKERGDYEMQPDKANTMACPFVARKCQAVKCMAWDVKEGDCWLLRREVFVKPEVKKEGPNA